MHILISFFFTEDPEKGKTGSSLWPTGRSGPRKQDVVLLSANGDAICCVLPPFRDPARCTGKRRFAYYLHLHWCTYAAALVVHLLVYFATLSVLHTIEVSFKILNSEQPALK
ncbi:hypothetical protein [[Erwinia] mediterraneensis]|uniref:hypothetical protein n=1 Tax=[Erwinia] mediterraneensis TaxID=2161819 RepID=UPI0010317263|nr:hypothetical protein [[Erwinia] mediterraneensis]